MLFHLVLVFVLLRRS